MNVRHDLLKHVSPAPPPSRPGRERDVTPPPRPPPSGHVKSVSPDKAARAQRRAAGLAPLPHPRRPADGHKVRWLEARAADKKTVDVGHGGERLG